MCIHMMSVCYVHLWHPKGLIFVLEVFVDWSSLFLFSIKFYVSSLLKFIGYILLISWKSNILGPIFQILALPAVLNNLTLVLQLADTLNPQQITKVFSKLLVCTKPLCTKLMMGINIYYLHMQKDIHIYFTLILSLFYKYCT